MSQALGTPFPVCAYAGSEMGRGGLPSGITNRDFSAVAPQQCNSPPVGNMAGSFSIVLLAPLEDAFSHSGILEELRQ